MSFVHAQLLVLFFLVQGGTATVLAPQAIVVKSGALELFAGHCIAWRQCQAKPASVEE